MRRQLYWEGLAWLRSTGPGTPITVCDHRDPGGPRRPGAKPCPTPHRQRPLPRLDLTPAGERETAKRDTLVKELGSFVPQASLIPGCNSDNENTCLERVSQFTNCFYITSSFKPQNKGPSEAEAHCLDGEARQALPSALGREGGTQIQTPPAADRGAAECAALPWQGGRAEGLGGLPFQRLGACGEDDSHTLQPTHLGQNTWPAGSGQPWGPPRAQLVSRQPLTRQLPQRSLRSENSLILWFSGRDWS